MHLPDQRTVEEQKEFYGPIDGVLPHSEYYREFWSALCLSGISFVNFQNISYLCEQCYYQNPVHSAEIVRVTEHALYPPWTHHDPKCSVCQRAYLTIRNAMDCRHCLEAYLLNKENLAAGYVIPVVENW